MPEVILLEPDPEARGLLRALLEREGYRVAESPDRAHARDALRATRARTVLTTSGASARFGDLVATLRATRPDLDVLSPVGYGAALLDGAAERDAISEFARDALLLLATLAEEGTRRPPAAERTARLAELTALKLDLGRMLVEACAAAAALVATGPSLAAFRFGGALQEQPADEVAAGLSRHLQASLAAAAGLRCPHDLRAIIEAVDEQFDGRGRPRGLAGARIPIAARIIAVARDYAALLAGGTDPAGATETLRSRVGTTYDPQVVDAFFLSLRDESYLERLESGASGARLLLVDGDAADLALGEMRLSQAGFDVTVAQDGARAFELIVQDPPDAVIADTMLPRVDGISLLLKMRRDGAARDVPLIFTSSRTDAGVLNKALKLGARDVLAKPINFDILLAKLRSFASRTQEERREASPDGGVTGDVEEMPLGDFFQVVALGRKTVRVSVRSPQHGRGDVYFEHGAPVAAATLNARGVDAFCEIVNWGSGAFHVVRTEGPPERNLAHTLDALLLQSAWNRGAGGPSRAAASPPAAGSPPQPDAAPPGPDPGAAPPGPDPYAAPPGMDPYAAPPGPDPDAAPPGPDPDAAPRGMNPYAAPPGPDPYAAPRGMDAYAASEPCAAPDDRDAYAARPGDADPYGEGPHGGEPPAADFADEAPPSPYGDAPPRAPRPPTAPRRPEPPENPYGSGEASDVSDFNPFG